MIFNCLKAAALWAVAVFVFAQVEVIDRVTPGSSSRSPQILPRQTTTPANAPVSPAESLSSPASGGQLSEMYFQVQMLQQEIQQLRGTVEELDYQVKQLKQQRLDDYLDLDRRIGLVSGGKPDTGSPVRTSIDVMPSTQSNISIEDSASSELSAYRDAMDLILKEKQFDQGAEALVVFLDSYPASRYAGNAQYWLGEVYLKKNDLHSAQQWFSTLLSTFPSHGKIIDAKYKLGTVYFLLGDNVAAKSLLEEVAASKTSTSGLAKDYLRANFPL